ncbi:MAG: helix-turn-helix protein [Methanoregulaceae archaeon PtaB.Bin152]|nr:MAG: helix-turn-helix protein [Methanoregulaceae archaeon PtaB.Bin152]
MVSHRRPMAQEMGVARQTILAIEKGKYYPSPDLAFRLARLLGAPYR